MVKLVVFDMDGVLFDGKNFWMDLHKALGTEEEGRAFASAHLRTDYPRLVELVMSIWAGRSAVPYIELVRARNYEQGVVETVAHIRQLAFTAIISTGPLELAHRAQAELGIDEVFANELAVEKGIITGAFRAAVKDDSKVEVFRSLLGRYNLSAPDVMFVGDGDNDVETARAAGVSVAYDPDSHALIEACDHVLQRGQFSKIRALL